MMQFDDLVSILRSDNHILRWEGEQPKGPSGFIHSRNPDGGISLCTFNIQVTVLGEARIDIVGASLTLGDGGAK